MTATVHEGPKCSRGWGNRCPAAKGTKCRCSCGGQNHGRATRDADRTNRHALWDVVAITDEDYTIRDIGHLSGRSITNDAEWVVEQIVPVLGSRRLFYYDSMGNLDELLVRGGRFAGFAPGPDREQRSFDHDFWLGHEVRLVSETRVRLAGEASHVA